MQHLNAKHILCRAVAVAALLLSPALQAAAPADAGLAALEQRIEAVGNRIERLQDLHEVEIVQHAYGYYVDKAQWRSLADLFTEDGTLEIGGKGVFLGKRRVHEYMSVGLGPAGPRTGLLIDHQQFQCLPTIGDDGVTARARCIAFVMSSGGWGHNYYENEYVKEGGTWKLKKLHGPFNMYSGYKAGWLDSVIVNTFPEKFRPWPDLPPTVVYLTYPSYYAEPFHYANPVTGRRAPPPSPRAGGEAFGRLVPVAAAAPTPQARMAEERARQARLPDTPGTGRFPALKEEVASLPDHVVYRPARLDALGGTKLGLYVFGNGGCVDDGASSRLHLLEVASHGYLVIAPGRIRTGPGATVPATPPRAAAPAPAPAPGAAAGTRVPLPQATSHRDLLSAIDWALAQAADPASPYHGRIDTQAIAVSGFSCGGLQALQVAGDPRVRTVVVMNSGIFNEGPGAISGMDIRKSQLQSLHTPVLYVLGGETDIAWPNGTDDVKRIEHVPVFLADLKGVGHGGTYWEPNGGRAATTVVAWLDWQLRGDAQAARQFRGAECGLCRDAAWAVTKKRID